MAGRSCPPPPLATEAGGGRCNVILAATHRAPSPFAIGSSIDRMTGSRSKLAVRARAHAPGSCHLRHLLGTEPCFVSHFGTRKECRLAKSGRSAVQIVEGRWLMKASQCGRSKPAVGARARLDQATAAISLVPAPACVCEVVFLKLRAVVSRRAQILGSSTLASLSLRLKDLPGPVKSVRAGLNLPTSAISLVPALLLLYYSQA